MIASISSIKAVWHIYEPAIWAQYKPYSAIAASSSAILAHTSVPIKDSQVASRACNVRWFPPRRSKAGSSVNAMAAALEAKYGNGNRAEHQDMHVEEPTEEEFQAAAARMKADKKKTSNKGKAGSAKSNGVGGSSTERQDLPEEPTEEEFAAAAARLKVTKKSSSAEQADDDAKRTAKPKKNKKRKANAE